eukprot:1366671-Amphidinium_carterae.1
MPIWTGSRNQPPKRTHFRFTVRGSGGTSLVKTDILNSAEQLLTHNRVDCVKTRTSQGRVSILSRKLSYVKSFKKKSIEPKTSSPCRTRSKPHH